MESESIITPLIAVMGVTASGKSALAMALAKKFNGEVVAADSRTVYKGMDVGTAKPSIADQAHVPHHLLDVVTPDRAFTVADFKRLARRAIQDITAREKLPIMVGGTGLYIDSVLFDYGFSGPAAARDTMNPRHLKKSAEHLQNPLRPDTLLIGLTADVDVIKGRIEKRVKNMLRMGLENEVRQLSERYGWDAPGLNAIGYREWKDYFAGNQTLADTQDLITTHSVQYAKRQRTWFKRNNSIHWTDDPKKVVDMVTTFLNKKQ